MIPAWSAVICGTDITLLFSLGWFCSIWLCSWNFCPERSRIAWVIRFEKYLELKIAFVYLGGWVWVVRVDSSAIVVSPCRAQQQHHTLWPSFPGRLEPVQELHMNVLHGTECNYGEIFPVLCPCDLEQNLTLQPGVPPTHSAMLWSVCWWRCLCVGIAKQTVDMQVCPSAHTHAEMAFTCSQHLSHCAVVASVCVPGTWWE